MRAGTCRNRPKWILNNGLLPLKKRASEHPPTSAGSRLQRSGSGLCGALRALRLSALQRTRRFCLSATFSRLQESGFAPTRVAPVTFLIDAYNLMHAIGLLRQGMPAKGLERARKRFLDWLADTAKGRDAVLRAVFDAQDAVGPSPESDHRGVRVRFAFHRTADDEIEELLAAERQPAQLAVVSNDTRLQAAGRRRGAVVFTCETFVDWLMKPQVADDPKPPAAEKADPGATPDEMAAWLAAFSAPKRRKR